MPLLDLIWTMLIWFLLFAWLVVIGSVVADVFRSDDLSGLAKAGWTLLVVFIPWLGVFFYLIARGESMTQRYAAAVASRKSRKNLPRSGTDSLAGGNPYGRASLTGGLDYDTAVARMVR
jgi:hypothetical protein